MKRCLKAEDCLESVKTQLSHITSTTPKNNSRLQPSSGTEPEHWSPPEAARAGVTQCFPSHAGVRGGGDDSGPSGCEGDYLLIEPLISLQRYRARV